MTELFGERRRTKQASTLWDELAQLRMPAVVRTRPAFEAAWLSDGGGGDDDGGGGGGGGGGDVGGSSRIYRRLGALKQLERQVTELHAEQSGFASQLRQLLDKNGRDYDVLAQRVLELARNFPDEKMDQ
jgi:hypothetical protein